jgi:hypothetical protein
MMLALRCDALATSQGSLVLILPQMDDPVLAWLVPCT